MKVGLVGVWFALARYVSAAAGADEPMKVKPPQQKTLAPQGDQRILASPNGRFVFGQVSDFRSDQYMLDTQTGQLWKIKTLSDWKNPDGTPSPLNGREALFIIPYIGPDDSLSLVPPRQQ